MNKLSRTLGATAAIGALVLSACAADDPLDSGDDGADQTADGEIIVGSADFTGNVVLAEIYAGALSQAGANVTTQFRVGTREALVRGLEDGSVSVVPEYTGNLLAYLDESATETEPDEIYQQLQSELPEDLSVLEPSQAQDTDVLVVTQETAAEHDLSTIEDLAPLCDEFTLGAAGEWSDRWEEEIEELYGCSFDSIQTTDAGGPVTVEALNNDDVDVANLFTTASAIEENDFVTLADTEQMYPAQNIVPLYRDGDLDNAARAVLNEVSAALDTETVTALLARVEIDNANATDVADEFLDEAGIGE